MKQVENKFYIEGYEVEKVAERYSVKIYKDSSNTYYVTIYDEVIAEFTTDSVNIPEEYIIKTDD